MDELTRYVSEFIEPNGLSPSYPFPVPEQIVGPRVLDLGAGFTSVVARVAGFRVTTVEHDPWFTKILRGYCESRGLTNGTWLSVDEWRDSDPTPHDTVVIDHGPTREDRYADLGRALADCAGVLLIDDWRGPYRATMHEELILAGWRAGVVYENHPRYVARAWRHRYRCG